MYNPNPLNKKVIISASIVIGALLLIGGLYYFFTTLPDPNEFINGEPEDINEVSEEEMLEIFNSTD